MSARSYPDVVFLLPGFLGFDTLDQFQYFTDRAGATLRTALWDRLAADVPVIPLATRPTASLARRQEFLVGRIGEYLDHAALHEATVHVVGHSTGGVDAWLLACERPLSEAPERDGDGRFRVAPDDRFRRVSDRIGSIVAISAPFLGAGVVRSPALQWIGDFPEHACRNRRGLAILARAMEAVARRSLRPDSGTFDLLLGAAVDARATLGIAADVARDRALVDDLLPESMARLADEAPFPAGRRIACLASVSPPPDACRDGPRCRPGGTGARTLYRLLYDQIRAAGEDGFHGQVQANLAMLAATGLPRIGRPDECPPPYRVADCDGIVNTASMVPARGGDLVALVFGDHADVIGHYDRCLYDRDAPPFEARADTGLLESGSAFDDDAFFALWRAVAGEIDAG